MWPKKYWGSYWAARYWVGAVKEGIHVAPIYEISRITPGRLGIKLGG